MGSSNTGRPRWIRCFRQKLRKVPPTTTIDSPAASARLRWYKSRRLPATATTVKVVGAPRKLTATMAFETSGVARTCSHVPTLASMAVTASLMATATAITRNKNTAVENTSNVGTTPTSRVLGLECKFCIGSWRGGSATIASPIVSQFSSMAIVPLGILDKNHGYNDRRHEATSSRAGRNAPIGLLLRANDCAASKRPT